MALQGKNILLTPDNLILPKIGLKELKACLIAGNGVLYEDKKLKVEYKSIFN